MNFSIAAGFLVLGLAPSAFGDAGKAAVTPEPTSAVTPDAQPGLSRTPIPPPTLPGNQTGVQEGKQPASPSPTPSGGGTTVIPTGRRNQPAPVPVAAIPSVQIALDQLSQVQRKIQQAPSQPVQPAMQQAIKQSLSQIQHLQLQLQAKMTAEQQEQLMEILQGDQVIEKALKQAYQQVAALKLYQDGVAASLKAAGAASQAAIKQIDALVAQAVLQSKQKPRSPVSAEAKADLAERLGDLPESFRNEIEAVEAKLSRQLKGDTLAERDGALKAQAAALQNLLLKQLHTIARIMKDGGY